VTVYLTLDDVTELAEALLALEGEQVGLRDPGLLQSALARPQATAFGEDAYPELNLKAAALMHSLGRNHPFVDGNKRVAWAATKLFLFFNDVHLRAPDVDQGETFVLAVASGEIEMIDIADTLMEWSSPV
jgi:death-on-curing protein